MEVISAENKKLETSTAEYVLHINRLNEYIDDLWARNEEETKLRKQFEAKMNALHSVCRDFEAKYNRSLEDIDMLEQQIDVYNKECKSLRK